MQFMKSRKTTLTTFFSTSNPLAGLVLVKLLVLLLLAALAPATFGQQTIAPPVAAPAVQSELSKREEAFQIVWQTVNELFYDPKFGGVDWAQMRERYQPQVANARSDREFHFL